MTQRRSNLSKRWKKQAKKKNTPHQQTPIWMMVSIIIGGILAAILISRLQLTMLNPDSLPMAATPVTVDASIQLLNPPLIYFATRTIGAYNCPDAGCSVIHTVPRGGSVLIDSIKDRVWGHIEGQEAYIKMDLLTRTDITQPLPTYPPSQAIPVNNASGGNSAPPRVDSSGGDKDCSDFDSHAEAQAFFKALGGPGSDPHQLDGDNDGIACEALR